MVASDVNPRRRRHPRRPSASSINLIEKENSAMVVATKQLLRRPLLGAAVVLLLPTVYSFQPFPCATCHTSNTNTRGFGAKRSAVIVQSSDTSTDITSSLASLLGGDYAGHSATFSSADGSLIPVPDHLVPESLVEWGQVPSCLEVLSSEDVSFTTVDDESAATVTALVTMERTVVSVVPEVGCGVDNLDTMRSTEKLVFASRRGGSSYDAGGEESVSQLYAFEDMSLEEEEGEDGECAEAKRVLAWETRLPPLRGASRVKVETIFSLPSQTGPLLDDEDIETDYARRIRVVFEAIPSEETVATPITVVLERRVADTNSGGAWGVGGGLDGRTVSKLIGKDNANKPFSDTKALLVGGDEDDGDSDSDEDTSETTLSLPGNIVVRHGSTDGGQWFVDLILVSTKQVDESAMISGTTIVRRIMNSESGSSEVECYFE
mmetsp:Transcript_34641/g.75822  ORF Transcript_34641/g.75822 Transcript_34641/m.75822 type:complete len:435 (-) Transcript_34641:47-1351(-)